MSVTTKMSVDVSGFKRGMAEAQASVKTMDAALKKNEAQYKATGNAEDYMSKKADILKQKLDSQNKAAKAAEQALQAMGKNGVDPASQEYQKMAQTLLNAQTAALETQNALNGLGESTQQAATGADNLTKSVNGISKKISLEQVITGVNKITTGLENAAKKAVQLGQELWNVIMDSAKRADDTATMAQMYGIDLDTFLRMQKLVAGGMDTTVDAMLNAQDKLTNGVGKGSDEVLGKLKELGVGIRTGVLEDAFSWRDKTPDELFWDVGDALMHMSDAYDKEAAAKTLFGRSWKELVPLFESYHSLEEYNAALEQQTVNSEDAIRDLAELNDAVGKLESSWTTLKDELLGAIAPALTKGAEAISGLLDSLTEYLQTDEGKQMLEDLGKAVEGLFEDISKIDPKEVVTGFVGVFNTIIEGLDWLVKNKQTVIDVLKGIVIGWGALKLTGGALEILKLVNGLQGLSGGAAAATAAGEAAGSAWGAGLAKGIMAAAPWVIGLINLLTPSEGGSNDTYDQKGLTREGFDVLYGTIGDNFKNQASIKSLAEIYGIDQTLKILRDPGASAFILKWLNQGGRNYIGAESVAEQFLSMYGYAPTGARYDLDNNQMGFIFKALGIDTENAWENMGRFSEGLKESMLEGLVDSPIDIPAELRKEDIMESMRNALAEIGTVKIPAELDIGVIRTPGGGSVGRGDAHVYDAGYRLFNPFGHANGLPFVPYDGYLSVLHRGERVMTASENRHYTYNSNNYFGNVNLNNGQDIEALTDAIDRRNRRQRSGYGA